MDPLRSRATEMFVIPFMFLHFVNLKRLLFCLIE